MKDRRTWCEKSSACVCSNNTKKHRRNNGFLLSFLILTVWPVLTFCVAMVGYKITTSLRMLANLTDFVKAQTMSRVISPPPRTLLQYPMVISALKLQLLLSCFSPTKLKKQQLNTVLTAVKLWQCKDDKENTETCNAQMKMKYFERCNLQESNDFP